MAKVGLIAKQVSHVDDKKGEKRKSYPACRPTKAQCTSAANKKKGPGRISWKDERVKKSTGGPVKVFYSKRVW